jgi:protein-tyrosine-phosphatase
LFVCTANRCRSVIAEWGFRDLLERLELHQFDVSSAGVVAVPDVPATGETVLVLSEHGINALAHRAAVVDRDLIESADIVLGMTRAHVDAIVSVVPTADRKTFLLTEFCPDEDLDGIDDPFGGSLDDYRRCLDDIQSCFEGVLAKLQGETV